jgi:Protein of unknown function (DUF2946)
MLYCNIVRPRCLGFRRKVPIGVNWFRSNIKHGSRVSLFALAIQFVLSFGHFHGIAAQAGPALQSGSTQTEFSYADRLAVPDAALSELARRQPTSNHDSDHHPGDVCAICAVIALANAVLFATPPLLQLPQTIKLSYLTTDAEFIHLNAVRVAFQPRAPPIS